MLPATVNVRVATVEPSTKKVTVPVGALPAPILVTVDVKVTVWPKTDGLDEALTVVCELSKRMRETMPGIVFMPK